MEKRITKQELEKMYGVGRKTIENWVKKYDLPLIRVSPNKKYIRKSDLMEWEESKMDNQL